METGEGVAAGCVGLLWFLLVAIMIVEFALNITSIIYGKYVLDEKDDYYNHVSDDFLAIWLLVSGSCGLFNLVLSGVAKNNEEEPGACVRFLNLILGLTFIFNSIIWPIIGLTDIEEGTGGKAYDYSQGIIIYRFCLAGSLIVIGIFACCATICMGARD